VSRHVEDVNVQLSAGKYGSQSSDAGHPKVICATPRPAEKRLYLNFLDYINHDDFDSDSIPVFRVSRINKSVVESFKLFVEELSFCRKTNDGILCLFRPSQYQKDLLKGVERAVFYVPIGRSRFKIKVNEPWITFKTNHIKHRLLFNL
jgi:hypothetical protein